MQDIKVNSLVFYNGSNYNDHFIINKLAEEKCITSVTNGKEKKRENQNKQVAIHWQNKIYDQLSVKSNW